MQPDHEAFEDEDEGPGLVQPDLIKSYLAFAVRALRARRGLMAAVFFPLLALTFVAAAVWPRTYHCESRLMAVRNQILEGDANGPRPLDGASSTITRRENLLAIAQRADLVHSWQQNRPLMLKLKDQALGWMRGTPSEADMLDGLARYLEGRLSATVEDATVLNVAADWSDPESAARIVATAQQTFLEARHAAEISMYEEKISILDGHASKLRDEIETIAEQLQRVRENKLAEAGKALKDLDAPGMLPSPSPAPAPAVRRTVARPTAAEPDEDLPKLKEQLEAKKRSIVDLEAERARRLTEAQAKVQELKYKYTPAHPQVLLAEQTAESLAHESPQVPRLKEEIQALEADIKARTAAQKGLAAAAAPSFAAGPVGATGKPAANAEPLSPKIMGLLESSAGVDPAVSTQLSGAVWKYGQLRDEIRTALIDLDKGQAAFNHRYRLITPPEPPSKPSKPKVPAILGGGFAAALLLALLIPILLELRRGIIVERWQVHQIQLPILAELELPPGSKE